MRLSTRLQDEWRCGYGLGREEGIGLGIAQGREEGIGQGVHAMISLLRDMGFIDTAICERLMQKFHLTYEDAAAAVAQYDDE